MAVIKVFDHLVNALIFLCDVKAFEELLIHLCDLIFCHDVLEGAGHVAKTDAYIILLLFVRFFLTLVQIEDVLLILIPQIIMIITSITLNNLIPLQLKQHPLIWLILRNMANLKMPHCIQHVHDINLPVVPLLRISDQIVKFPVLFVPEAGAAAAT